MTTTDTAPAPTGPARPHPVTGGDRIFNLDMLRGLAVLGILAVNALSFAWPFEVYGDPESAPFAMAGANKIGTWVTDVFFHDKFRSLFSMLFGVSIFLVGGERSDKVRGKLLRSRLFWLFVIGLIHGLGIWYGDILMHYAYTGLLMLLMRSMSAGKLLWIGGGVSLFWGVVGAGMAILMANLPPEVRDGMGGPEISPEKIAATIEAVRTGGWIAAMTENLRAWAFVQGFSLALIPVTLPLMMLGLGLFKSGWLAGKGAIWTYLLAIAAGAAILAGLGWYRWQTLGVEDDPTGGLSAAMAQFGFVITLGYAALLILLTKGGLRIITGRLAPVGRMAFTNYLTQSILMASLFYMPWGPLLYGQWGPAMIWSAVGGIWILQLIWSPLWLSRFEMGPLEWIWRCLTYGRMVPLLKR
ncbi:hypothetical protein KOAAANKH_00176 [Brevundimonas sp. NIBR10]|uniref:DUF418 domain-containing protein n=1 Tax=Brevundimonas sp. NIBR10 TaxID=3015997 RepID=UPI0022F16A81|nr:DUF418 domain-containing protein [Brevundimonas sp. NIBR10]WGM45314.1 hypothetical protein KOAAANKH_00176 [Brevundimonas sp. NIBR10]